jgi:hypothetical protein
MLTGYWNGDKSANFIGVIYKVDKAPTPTWWQNRIVGTQRQGLMITYANQTWLIDNECGDGYYKLTEGLGSWRCGHKSLADYTIVKEIPDEQINKEYNGEKLAEESRLHDEWMEQNYPEDFKRLQALKASIRSFRNK